MSQKASYHKLLTMNGAFCDGRLTASDKVVFQRLVWRVNLVTGACFPSVGLIAKELAMTDRGVRKCIAHLEKHGYVRRRIHAGRTKANDYLIPGLNAERQFREPGTDVPKKRNDRSAQIANEKEKEKDASEGMEQPVKLSSPFKVPPGRRVVRDQFQNQLAEAFGGGAQGWAVLINVPAERLEELEADYCNGSLSLVDAVELLRDKSLERARLA